METMWAPWRNQYMADMGRKKKTDEDVCVFCAALEAQKDAETFIVRRGKKAFAILNIFPYNLGHMLVLPNDHVEQLDSLSPDTYQELMMLVFQGQHVLMGAYQPHGINIGANLGSAAGAGMAHHLHFHILPRWTADVNFVTTIGNTRVIPATLEDTWNKVREIWNSTYGVETQ